MSKTWSVTIILFLFLVLGLDTALGLSFSADNSTTDLSGDGESQTRADRFQHRLVRVVEELNKNESLTRELQELFDDGDKLQLASRTFPCTRLPASNEIPNSVHQLQPSDIKVIAAIGDSLTAARAAGGKGILSLLYDYRGLSWSAGGDETYKTFSSLPNILKEFNPDLYGYSTGIGNSNRRENVAVSGATSKDIFHQAYHLVHTMRKDPNIDVEKDWKLVTLFIGGNDLCDACLGDFKPNQYIDRIRKTLNYLQESSPRTFVNLGQVLQVDQLREMHNTPVCSFVQKAVCECAAFPRKEADYRLVVDYRKQYQKMMEDLIASGTYDKKEDFTVVLQPMYKDTKMPRDKRTGKYDYSYMAVDCFHQSKKGQALAGLSLWNNMMQPVGSKSTRMDWKDSIKPICPTQDAPYLFTANNSVEFHKLHSSGDAVVRNTFFPRMALPMSIFVGLFIVIALLAGFVYWIKGRKSQDYELLPHS